MDVSGQGNERYYEDSYIYGNDIYENAENNTTEMPDYGTNGGKHNAPEASY